MKSVSGKGAVGELFLPLLVNHVIACTVKQPRPRLGLQYFISMENSRPSVYFFASPGRGGGGGGGFARGGLRRDTVRCSSFVS